MALKVYAIAGCCNRHWPALNSNMPMPKPLTSSIWRRPIRQVFLRNRPFVDGNKRTGFLVGIPFLELNGYRFAASEEDAAQAVLKLAEGTLDEAVYNAFLRGNAVRKKR